MQVVIVCQGRGYDEMRCAGGEMEGADGASLCGRGRKIDIYVIISETASSQVASPRIGQHSSGVIRSEGARWW